MWIQKVWKKRVRLFTSVEKTFLPDVDLLKAENKKEGKVLTKISLARIMPLLGLIFLIMIPFDLEPCRWFHVSVPEITRADVVTPSPKAPVDLVIDLSIAKVQVFRYQVDRLNKEVELELQVTRNNGSTAKRKMVLSSSGTDSHRRGGRIELTDLNGFLLYGMVFGWNANDPNSFSVTEKTSTDELTVTRSVGLEVVKESYTINGFSGEFEFPKINEAELNAALKIYQEMKASGDFSRLETVDMKVKTFVEEIREFDQFYSPFRHNSLHDNADGELLASLLVEEKFAQWLEYEIFPNYYPDMSTICTMAAICAMGKCLFGGGANPVCAICVGATVGCAILELLGAL
jgi:hypothetical protein